MLNRTLPLIRVVHYINMMELDFKKLIIELIHSSIKLR